MSNPLKEINETLQGMSAGSSSSSSDNSTALGTIADKIQANTEALGTIVTKLGDIVTKLGNIDGHLNPLYAADYVAPEGSGGSDNGGQS